MDYIKLRSLIDKFYEGNTSTAEEDYIRKCLADENIPSGFMTEKQLFDSFSALQKESEPPYGIEEEIISMINPAAAEHSGRRRLFTWIISAAAVILLAVIFNMYYPGKKMKDTFTDADMAYAYTEKVLTYISQTINSETVKLEEVNRMTRKMSAVNNLHKINESIENIKNIRK